MYDTVASKVAQTPPKYKIVIVCNIVAQYKTKIKRFWYIAGLYGIFCVFSTSPLLGMLLFYATYINIYSPELLLFLRGSDIMYVCIDILSLLVAKAENEKGKERNMNKKTLTKVITPIVLLAVVLSMLLTMSSMSVAGTERSDYIGLFDGDVQTNVEDLFDSNVVHKLPSTVSDTDIISLIIKTDLPSVMDAYREADTDLSLSEYANSEHALAIKQRIAKEQASLLASLDKAGLDYTLGLEYNTVLAGFEITLQAGDLEAVDELLQGKATAIVGEVYLPAETKLVENTVDVYDTGIFDSSNFAYDGTGMVVAVLDTGLDYYHSAFSVGNFTADRDLLGMTFSDVEQLVGKTEAAGIQSGLTASDVYINEKVPYSFDYADRDSDVYPIQSDHGTHVSGIIAGRDDKITGVAPNAQLVAMKIFSDTESSARTSWILGALEDCVVLGVDVINLSIGTSCGFSTENEKEQIAGVFDHIREAGISLVVAASNSYNSTYGSEKNGNLGLTSNPDSATVGSPSTYAGALCVASIEGAKTPYMLYNGKIIYFTDSADRAGEEKHLVEDILPDGVDSLELEFIVIPGAGRSADYTGIDVTGKVALVARGSTTFEEKVNVAQNKGAAAVIIYNNVSGEIRMNVGDATIPSCSISQDDGEMLEAAGTGTIVFSRAQTSGPFMSGFSSWGPTPDLEIKPEITAHGGSILSAVPGQDYDRISGTSMAAPNMSGVVALLRQYVKANFPDIADNDVEVAALVNRLLMSTADVVLGKNGLLYSVRKQGAGLANLDECALTTAYIQTYDKDDGSIMDKSKIELGDDPDKNGVYVLKFSIVNFGSTALTYDISAVVMTEGVSETKTVDGQTVVTEEGYLLEGVSVAVTAVGGGQQSGQSVTVAAGTTADVELTITLSDADKKYLDDSFANGMYVEGFVKLDAQGEGTVDLGCPFLAFYGDWTRAPMFDLEYFETHKDELDDAIDFEDKTMPDAYASRPIGSLYGDYVSYLGSFYFIQDPASKMISANRDYISLSNQEGAINSLEYVWLGMLRGAREIKITITEDSTGEVVFERTEEWIRKAYSDGGPSIYPANLDVGFSAIEQNLKNNTKYTVTIKGLLDYGDGGADTNLRNTMTFPLYTDFQAPAVTDTEFYTEYDKSEKINRLYAKVSIYDNHYAMGMQAGYVALEESGYIFKPFGKYVTAIYSEYNSTTEVILELTDYVDDIKAGAAHKNTFALVCYDYAMNEATYEIGLPDAYTDFYLPEFADFVPSEQQDMPLLTLSPYQTYELNPVLYPGTSWAELLDYVTFNPDNVQVIGNTLVAVTPGTLTRIRITDPYDSRSFYEFRVKVLSEGDEGYVKYDKPVTDFFDLTGYFVDKAFYFVNSADRKLGVSGDESKFGSSNYALEMYPSESVTVRYKLNAYFPESTEVVFESSNPNIVTVDAKTGTIVAQQEGFATISAMVQMDGNSTYYSKSISIEVKEPYVTSGPVLQNYFGLGGTVVIPESLSLTQIGQFAFSNYDYVDKDPSEITEEDPESSKMWFIGEDTIKEVVIPEGVETISAYAFANLTALERVVLPSTLTRIDWGAFYGCTSLKTVIGLENVKFINEGAFEGCALSGSIKLDKAVAIADYAFAGNRSLSKVTVGKDVQSIGMYAFAQNSSLNSLTIEAPIYKLGKYAFTGCESLTQASINAAVIPTGAFQGAKKLEKITLGKDVAVINENAFGGTKLASITVDAGNSRFESGADLPYLVSADGSMLILVAPATSGEFAPDLNVTSIGTGAFSGNANITSVVLPGVTQLSPYAFAGCTRLRSVTLGELTEIGAYAFAETGLTQAPSLEHLSVIGDYAFSASRLTSVTLPDGITVGTGAFAECRGLESVTVGNNVMLGDRAFYLNSFTNREYKSEPLPDDVFTYIYYVVYKSPLHVLTIGDNVRIGNHAFYGAAELESVTLGDGISIGDFAFFNAAKLSDIDLSRVVSIGASAFSGDVYNDYYDDAFTAPVVDANGEYVYRYFAPIFTAVDLDSLTSLGAEAFAYCQELETVVLGDGLTAVPDKAFLYCRNLSGINLEKVTEIGSNTFYTTDLVSVDLRAVQSVGTYAFAYCEKLNEVTFGAQNTTVLEGAFAYDTALATVNGMQNLSYVGDYAFAYSILPGADLSSATYIGAHAFYKDTVSDFALTLGSALTELGDNPFAMCRLERFSSTETISFNGKDYESVIYTYDISDTVRVIDGHLYRVVPKGLELISYTGDDTSLTVADGTVRISAMAFAGTPVKQVVLPYTVSAIGHKAFFDCDQLRLVTFSSYNAPILEEEYDALYHQSGDNIPATGDYSFYDSEGNEIKKTALGIINYYMWNAADTPYSTYYGANFVDYIGHIESPITMVRPVNGNHYDSFIFAQYFDTVIDGSAAADATTLAAIAAIDAIPENVTLADKALVEAARTAYDKISTMEQKALVYNLDKLTAAERRIADLEALAGEGTTAPEEQQPPKGVSVTAVLSVALGVLGTLSLALAVLCTVLARKVFTPEYVAACKEAGKKRKEAKAKSADKPIKLNKPHKPISLTKNGKLSKLAKLLSAVPLGKIFTVTAIVAIGAAVVLMAVTLFSSAGSQWKDPYKQLDKQGYSVSVRFDAGEGQFAGRDVTVIDVFSLDDYQIGEDGNVQISLLDPQDKLRGAQAYVVDYSGHVLAGWYTDRQPRTDEQGNPVDAYGELTSVSGREQGWIYSGRWDFDKDTLTVDPSTASSGSDAVLTLYAAWVPGIQFNLYNLNELDQNGNPVLLETYVGSKLSVPAWNNGAVSLGGSFPKLDGTPNALFADKQMTQPITEPIKLEINYENGTTNTPAKDIYVDLWEGTWFKISSAKQFYKHARADGNYIIEADLDFSAKGTIWPTNFYKGQNQFTGTIIGNGHKMSNITVVQPSGAQQGGLFGFIGAGANISDLHFENVTFTAVGSRIQGSTVGILAGTISDQAVLDNISVSGKLLIDPSLYLDDVDCAIYGLIAGAGNTAGISLENVSVEATGDNKGLVILTLNPETGEVIITKREQN